MDEVYSIFLETVGGVCHRQEVPPTSVERYQGLLPDLLLDYWKEHGWCGYGDGIFWLVNPQEYEGVLASWLISSSFNPDDTYHVIARNAFGDLYLWGEKTGPSLRIYCNVSRYMHNPINRLPQAMNRALQAFLLSLNREYLDFDDLFDLARRKLGVVSQDEIYGFTPALQLGGSATLKCIEKVKAFEHMIFLSQLDGLRKYTISDLN
ncbi:GAD-like domain-containing protein [Pseudomonas sp. PSKL.D1]|uniref:GAD-like domain-containing protein n=1 Tax=Pseudomonas sp. PSKL.D1 TaxID=3029060 RepID=UPI0023817D2F|nr:GAD-like domain-containing protein [Pseudomonas sp. PSKL.D1]WDY56098.1 GAD-like domain-containing protein [Pseudomonas sp. PSKL.D1]